MIRIATAGSHLIRSQDREDYSETEADYLATIEEDLPAGLDELVDLVMDFIEEELA